MPQELAINIKREQPMSIVVVGASGDLSIRKILPALFALYCQDLLPKQFRIVGYARSEMDSREFRERAQAKLTCRYGPCDQCAEKQQQFLERVTYVSGQYDSAEDFRKLESEIHCFGDGAAENRIFYMSVPPFLFLKVAHAIHDAGLVTNDAEGGNGWSRVVVEKPFGSDRGTSDDLTQGLAEVFTEDQTYRIDHYLGKEVIQNLMVLRFANLIFDPMWNRAHIDHVMISWTENLSLEGRAGYFDSYGIIRDVMQNHLLQMLSLVAMEQPLSLKAQSVRDEKVKALRAIPPLTLDSLVVGQYSEGVCDGVKQPAYLEEDGVPKDSITPTFAAAVLYLKNRRWDGVPFLIRAGKGMNANMTEIRIRFRKVPGNIFAMAAGHLAANELVIQIQPDAHISLRVVNKVPGLKIRLEESELDLNYASAFVGQIPDAYEALILDVVNGDKGLFIRADELEAAWDVFTPVLHELEEKRIKPQPYAFGGHGPEEAYALAARFGAKW